MKTNSTINSGNALGQKIRQSIHGSTQNVLTSTDRSLSHVRADVQQRFGSLQMLNIYPNQYAMFGAWSNNSSTVGP